jgi:hypothetical protein
MGLSASAATIDDKTYQSFKVGDFFRRCTSSQVGCGAHEIDSRHSARIISEHRNVILTGIFNIGTGRMSGTLLGRVVFGWSVNCEIALLVPVWVTWLALQAIAGFSDSICK